MNPVSSDTGPAAVEELGCGPATSRGVTVDDADATEKKPHKKKNGLDAPAKKSVQTAEENPTKEITHMEQSTNGPANARGTGDVNEKPGMTVPRTLEVPGTYPEPPSGFTPNYDVNEYAKDPQPELVDYSAPNIERPGYKILSSWTPAGGLRLYIDHDDNESFSVPELCDLISTLSTALRTMVEEAPCRPEAPEGSVKLAKDDLGGK